MSANSANSGDLETREEYMKKLLSWIEDAKNWQKDQLQHLERARTNSGNPNEVPFLLNQETLDGYEYIVPPLWKRVVAELIDFCFLFIVKTFIIFSILESFDIISADDLGIFNKNLQNADIMYHMSMEFLILEILHRFVVFCYETLWLSLGPRATPGKMFMGLMVVEATVVAPIEGRAHETVKVFTGTQLTIKEALTRSIVKSLTFAIPLCFAILFFKHNRTGYDLMSHTIVVQYNPNPPPAILF
ncbi:protein FAM8A1 [Agrilus planipennis]|uniref:Protein FAM8A1 n=1 Tax=Agrilus planipennis TaxID=224129 RepID=A0A7F5RD43_AGRPL|nr:protein FAM8A1 [Agrilus planipennis]